MKKYIILAVIGFSVFGFTTSSFAAKVYKSSGIIYTQIEGTVAKLIPHQRALIIKDKVDGEKTHIHVDSSTLAALELGDSIKVRMQGSNCMVERVVIN